MAERTRYEDLIAVGPGSLAGRFLRMFWQPVFQSEKLEVGRPVPVRVLGEDFTLYRGRTGSAHLVGPRCPHRGLALCTGRVQGDDIECFYHGWKFDPDGRCIAQPAETQSFAHKIKIPAYPTIEYVGLIFAYLGAGQPPQLPRLDLYEQSGLVQNRESRRPWPFFAQIENSLDETHFNFVHRKTELDDVGFNDALPELSCDETEYGLIRRGKRGNQVRISHFMMPNWSLSSNYGRDMGWSEHLVWRVPIDDASHVSFSADFVYKTGADADAYRRTWAQRMERAKSQEPAMSLVERVLRGEMQADDLPTDRPDLVMLQDSIACMGQDGTKRNREEDLLGASDRVVSLIRRLWTRELRAVDAGRPITAWRVPRNLATTKGVAA